MCLNFFEFLLHAKLYVLKGITRYTLKNKQQSRALLGFIGSLYIIIKCMYVHSYLQYNYMQITELHCAKIMQIALHWIDY